MRTQTWHLQSVHHANANLLVGTGVELNALERAENHRDRLGVRLREAERLKAVARLAGGIAHHFNNVLTSSVLVRLLPRACRCAPACPKCPGQTCHR